MIGDLQEFVGLPDDASRREWVFARLSTMGKVLRVQAEVGGPPADHSSLLLIPSGHVQRLLVAHFDRVPGTPGANDNSAACIQLLHAVRKGWQPKSHVAVAFTDLEETDNCHALGCAQVAGARAIASWFEAHGGLPPEIFVFDATGIGDRWVSDEEGVDHPLLNALVRISGMDSDVSPLKLTGDNIAFPGSVICCVMTASELDYGLPFSWASIHTDLDTVDDIWPETMERVSEAMASLMS